MGWWLNRYLEAIASNDGLIPPDPKDVYVALVFDGAGVSPGLKNVGFQVLEVGDLLETQDAIDFVRNTIDASFGGVHGERRAEGAGGPVIFASEYKRGVVTVEPRKLARGSLVVVEDAGLVCVRAVDGKGTALFGFVAEVLPAAFGPSEGEALARALYGDDAIVPPFPDSWSGPITDVLVAAATAKTAPQFVESLVEIGRRAVEESEAASKEDDGPRRSGLKADAKAKEYAQKSAEKAAAAQIVDVSGHKKLSEMHGFGAAAAWGMRLAQDLRDYRAGELAWEDVDKGVLLTSPPGGGKSTFARALAAECGLPLYVSTYGEWEQRTTDRTYVVKIMQDAFENWRAAAAKGGPIIVFIDEIDSVGARGLNGHNEGYWTPVINALLAFMDGAVPRDGVVVIGATNFPGRVDPALKRPGRLDREIAIPRPDEKALVGMLAHHLDVDPSARETMQAARALRGRSPAELEQVCREARRVGRAEKRRPTANDVVALMAAAREEVTLRKDRQVRVHEAGHAVATLESEAMGWTLVHVDAQRVDDFEGVVSMRTPSWALTRAEVVREMAIGLAGRVAEEAVVGVGTASAAIDLQMVTARAASLVRQDGLGSTLLYHTPGSPLTPAHAEEVEGLVREAYDLAKTITPAWRVRTLAALLVDNRSMSGDEVRAALKAHQAERFFAVNGDSEPEEEWPLAA